MCERLTNAWSPGLTTVVQKTHICQAISIIHTTASLQDLSEDQAENKHAVGESW